MNFNYDSTLLEDGLVLTDAEMGALKSLLDHGDRAGFYAAYQAITSAVPSVESASSVNVS